MIYFSEIESRLAPGACLVTWLPIQLFNLWSYTEVHLFQIEPRPLTRAYRSLEYHLQKTPLGSFWTRKSSRGSGAQQQQGENNVYIQGQWLHARWSVSLFRLCSFRRRRLAAKTHAVLCLPWHGTTDEIGWETMESGWERQQVERSSGNGYYRMWQRSCARGVTAGKDLLIHLPFLVFPSICKSRFWRRHQRK